MPDSKTKDKAEQLLRAAPKKDLTQAFLLWLSTCGIEYATSNDGAFIRICTKDAIIKIWPTAEKLHVCSRLSSKRYNLEKVILGTGYMVDYIKETFKHGNI